jgi:hypothetical protein
MAAVNIAEGIAAKLDVAKLEKAIPRYFPKKIYHVTFEQRDGVEPGIDIIIYNENVSHQHNSRDVACIVCELFYYDSSRLHIESLKQCGLNGTTHLERLIDFSEEYGFSRITLEDGSRIEYTSIDDPTDTSHSISLKQLRRLMTGRAWYEKFGFTNIIIDKYKDNIQAYIESPIGPIYTDELMYRIQDYASEINPDIASDNTSDKMRATSVSDATSYLYTYLTDVCPRRSCPPKVDIAIVDDIDDIIDKLYQGMLTSLGLVDRHFIYLQLNLPRRNQTGSSRKTRRTRRRYNKKAHTTSRRQKRTRRHT